MTHMITFNGETKGAVDWSKELSLNYGTILSRINKGIVDPNILFAEPKEAKKYEYNQQFKTLREWSEELNISLSTLQARVRKKFPIDKVFSVNKIKGKRVAKTLTYNGETHTIKEWAEKLDIKLITIYARIKRNKGLTIEQILSEEKFPKGKMIEYDGRTQNLKEWSKEIGISSNTLQKRIKENIPLEIAMQKRLPKAKNTKIGRLFTYNGKTQNIAAWAKELGITRERLRQRLLKSAPEVALSYGKVPANPPRMYTFKGKTLSLDEWAKKLNVCRSTLNIRLKEFPIEKAFVKNRMPKRSKLYEYNGKEYSKKQLAEKFNVSYGYISIRINKFDTIEEALNFQKYPRKVKRYEYEGEMLSVKEISKKFKVSEAVVRSRLNEGMAVKDIPRARNKNLPKDDGQLYEYDGNFYTIRDICLKYGLYARTLKSRLERGDSLEKIIKRKKFKDAVKKSNLINK